MSCTENESGPFVVFLLPAVVGCLTILLARRWANTQSSNTSTTAVSRRRKIIKDPLIKRPLPSIPCKMVPPLSKKASGLAKKGSYSLAEEDTNSQGKRVHRPSRVNTVPQSTSSSTSVKSTDAPSGPVGPKHIPFPVIPQDGELLFESMTCVFTMVATGLQYLNIYRTSWWLPHLQTTQTINVHLIDMSVVGFILTILLRRVLYCLLVSLAAVIWKDKNLAHATYVIKSVVLGLVVGCAVGCSYSIFTRYPPIKTFYLWYPAVIYLLLFGLQSAPLLELSPPMVFHSCSTDPQQISAEVDSMKRHFNQRASRILFNSIIGAYYSSFIPCCFAQPFVYYDVYGACQQVCLVWGGLCGRYAHQLAGAHSLDTPHRTAHHLAVTNGPPEPLEAQASCTGLKLSTTAPKEGVPLRVHHSRFYSVFKNPSKLLSVYLCMQLSLIVLQLCLLFSSVPWHNFLSTLILLFVNYYTLFKMVRDYLVAWKVYKTENMIQDKSVVISSN